MNTFKPRADEGEDLVALARELCRRMELRDPLTEAFARVALLACRVFDLKQRCYGPGNIAAFGEHGVLVRTHDKLQRLLNLSRTGEEPGDETKDDSWGDLAVYSLIALLCRWGRWPGVPAAGEPAP